MKRERHSRTHRLALCFLSVPPCHHSGNGWEYLPIRRLRIWYISHGQLDGCSGGVDGVLRLEPRPVRALQIECNTKSNIWSMEHGSKTERERQKFREIFIPCVALLSHKYCYRKLTPGNTKSVKHTCKHGHQHLPPAISIHTAVFW